MHRSLAMTSILIAILTFLMFPYIFWTLSIGTIFWAYYLTHDEDDFSFGAAKRAVKWMGRLLERLSKAFSVS